MLHHKLQMLISSASAGIYPVQNGESVLQHVYDIITSPVTEIEDFERVPESIESLSSYACYAGTVVFDDT